MPTALGGHVLSHGLRHAHPRLWAWHPLKYTRLLLTLCLLFGALTSAVADNAPATVVVGGKSVPFVVSPYVDRDGQVYVPVDVVHLMGANYAPNPDGKTVKVTPLTGPAFDVPFQFVRSRFCVPLLKYASQLGASAKWDDKSRTLSFRAKLLMVHADGSGLTVATSYPVYYRVKKLDKETRQDPIRRIYVDMDGVDLAASPTSIPSTEPEIAFIRTGYVGDGIARVVIDLKRKLDFKVDSPSSTNNVRVAMAGLDEPTTPPHPAPTPVRPPVVATGPKPTRPEARPPVRVPTAPPAVPVETAPIAPLPVTPPTQSASNDSGDQAKPDPTVPTATGNRILDVTSTMVSPDVTQISIKTSAAMKYRWLTLDDPYRLAFDLAGAGVDPGLQTTQQVASTIVKDVRAGTITAGTNQFGRVVIDLSQAVDFSVSSQQADDGMIYTISLQRPTVVTTAPKGDLKGKVVMVDPGHGGGDTGAVDEVTKSREKDFNLAIAKKVRDSLARAGATVYMTREDDILPSVGARPKMAIAVGADFFVSIHCDDSGGPRDVHSGTTVYYHAQNQTCRRLALDIVHRVFAVSGLSSNNVKSDTIRFHTGFGVLRGSPMPAVLVECGYMNNTNDVAKLRTDEVQQHFADGIVAGLIDFVNTGG